MLYGERLKKLREENDAKQENIRKIIDVSKQAYNNFEKEHTIIPIIHLNNLCNYFNVSLDYIFGFIDIKQYNNSSKEINNKLSAVRLENFRKQQKLSQEALADFLDITHQAISNYECAKSTIATLYLFEICKEYKISADYLLGKIDEPEYLN